MNTYTINDTYKIKADYMSIIDDTVLFHIKNEEDSNLDILVGSTPWKDTVLLSKEE